MTAESAATTSAEAAVLCPMCGYDLRGQVEPRCPECGYRFDFAELRDPARRLHPYLFEHHPDRNLRSFFATLIGGLRPRRFWATLYPTQPSRPRRLILYIAVIVLLTVLPAVALIARQMLLTRQANALDRATFIAFLQSPRGAGYRRSWGALTLQQIVDRVAPVPTATLLLRQTFHDGTQRVAGAMVLLPLLWVTLTLAAMMIFRFSMRRARVRTIHVMRCVLYSGDVIAWWGLLAVVLLAVSLYGDMKNTNPAIPLQPPTWPLTILLLALPVFMHRFTVALRQYLRFDHCTATMLATQTIVFLFILTSALRVYQAPYF